MIELKNVSKTYKSKKGNNTKALDNVTLKFDNKGMTFILGKSGSGKSTLLNIIGGLDKYDSGDMIILGKSSKDFNQADFDSYRNTYIGFVFQEFNILEDYNVYENIVLALQLQQKEINKKEVDNLLSKLELTELKNRKVNELSGGQKQRVAIARALIKNPKIILADEPTGNLDSNTGKQVMDLLKEISKEKLVIVVSHDSESAHTYGDRIIEIKDGQVINDTKKVEQLNLKEHYQTIKSKLPLKESFKLGVGSLRHKKIKLLFTIILVMCSLLFLSITDTLTSYNVEKAHAKLLTEKEEQFVQINKYWYFGEQEDDYFNKEQLSFNNSDQEEVQSKIDKEIYPIYHLSEDFDYKKMGSLLNIGDVDSTYLYFRSSSYIEAEIVEINDLNKVLKEKVIGRKPQTTNEIVISNYVADLIIEGGINVYEKVKENEFGVSYLFKPQNYQELLNSNYTFYFGSKGKVKIVGIIDYDLSKYESLKGKKDDYRTTSKEENDLTTNMRKVIQNIYGKIYVLPGFMNNLETINKDELDEKSHWYSLTIDHVNNNDKYYVRSSLVNSEIDYFDGTTWKKTSSIEKNEMVVSLYQLKGFDIEDYQKNLDLYIEKNPFEDEKSLTKRYFENYVKKFNVIGKNATLVVNNRINNQEMKYQNIKVIGITAPFDEETMRKNYFSEELVSDYQNPIIQQTGYLVPTTEKADFEKILTDFKYSETLSAFSTYSEDVVMLIWTILKIKKIAFIVSIVLLVFTIFLIANFVFTSIGYRKKEIGVLRALGARSNDIVKIFLWEGLTMALISGTLASVLLVFVTNLFNTLIMTETELIITPFILGFRQFLVIYIVVFLVTVISSILPIRKIAKMKPIDAILNK